MHIKTQSEYRCGSFCVVVVVVVIDVNEVALVLIPVYTQHSLSLLPIFSILCLISGFNTTIKERFTYTILNAMVAFYHRSSSSSLHKNIIFFITFPFTIILYPLGSYRITIMYSFFIYSKGVFNFLYFISSKKYYQTAPVILKSNHSKDLSRSKLHSNPIKNFLFVTKKNS